MEYIKNKPMTVSSFLIKLEQISRYTYVIDESHTEVKISFFHPFTWSDGNEKIINIVLKYIKGTNNICKLTFIGNNLTQIIGYTYLNESYMWFTVKDMKQFDFEHINDCPGVLALTVQS